MSPRTYRFVAVSTLGRARRSSSRLIIGLLLVRRSFEQRRRCGDYTRRIGGWRRDDVERPIAGDGDRGARGNQARESADDLDVERLERTGPGSVDGKDAPWLVSR